MDQKQQLLNLLNKRELYHNKNGSETAVVETVEQT
jgi:hypothetical protein